MIDKKLKIAAVIIGIISLLYSAYSLWVITMLIGIDEHFSLSMLAINPIFTYFLLSPLFSLGLFFASFGLFNGRKWGHLLSNICLSIFLGGFALVIIHHFYPDLINSTIELNTGQFVFYHLHLNLETLAAPILVTILLILLNIKYVRRVFK